MSAAANDTHTALIGRFETVLGRAGVLTEPQDLEPYVVDWRGRTRGKTFALLRPTNADDVAAVVRICAATRTAIVPQGGNTGQCAGAIPSLDGDQVILSLARMNRIRAIDVHNSTLTAEAGCVLASIQEAAATIDHLFPLSLGAQGSCQIGGNLATNAGGTAVLRYGNARDMVLGLEVVLADGSLWNGLRALRKDNTGYDLKQIFLGAEGTLGIITAAVLKLYPRAKRSATALLAIPSPQIAVELLNRFRASCGDRLTGFEIISRLCLDLLFKHIPKHTDPFAKRYPWYVLAEINDTLETTDLQQVLEAVLESALHREEVLDAVVASSQSQAAALWQMRDDIPEGNRKEGPWVRHDVAVPVSRIAELIARGTSLLESHFPGVRVVAFGHIGDGNVHFNATAAEGEPPDAFTARQSAVYGLVHDLVMSLGGSFSAEHGIGGLKVHEMERYKSALELDMMQRIKKTFDPLGIMNPGKLLPAPKA